MTHVPWKGSGQAIVDLLAGTVDLDFESPPNASQGSGIIGGTSGDFADLLPRYVAAWAQPVKRADIRPD